MAWFFKDESSPYADRVAGSFSSWRAVVPAIRHLEQEFQNRIEMVHLFISLVVRRRESSVERIHGRKTWLPMFCACP